MPILKNLSAFFTKRKLWRSIKKRLPRAFEHSSTSSSGNTLITLEVRARLASFPAGRPCIVLVTHSSARTGVPDIALELARRFRTVGSVITISARSGSLDPHYTEASDLYLAIPDGVRDPLYHARLLIADLAQLRPFSFAVVNSVASWPVLYPLEALELPTLLLVHEYLSTTPEAYSMPAWIWNHPFAVFPAANVLENAIRTQPSVGTGHHAVCVPGVCHEPQEPLDFQARADEEARVRALIRPESAKKAVVVLGVGTVCLRGGTDLFFMVASGLLRKHPTLNWRFVWVGGGYDPINDPHFSRTLQDQIHHLGLEDVIVFAGEIDNLETAHLEADLLFLSSRADPLPLVAQAAMRHGLPVVCFEKTTGLAEHLLSDPLTAPLVVPHLDIQAALERIADLGFRTEHRNALGSRCREIARRDFCLDRYFNELKSLADKLIATRAQLPIDHAFLSEADVLDGDFLALPDDQPNNDKTPVRTYLRLWSGGVALRKPFPGFHPGIYRENIDTGACDPLCHWLAEGRPAGPWQIPVIRPETSVRDLSVTRSSPLPRTALHIHVFYPELIPDFVARLVMNLSRPDLWLTIPEHLDPANVLEGFADYNGRIECQTVPNRGRDLGPLITALGKRIVAEYDIVGHVHTKKTAWHPDIELITRWREFLLQNTLGGKYAMMDVILEYMARDPELGLVFPNTCMAGDWNAVKDKAQKLARRMKIPSPTQNHLDFPAGSFFWARTRAIQPWLESGLDWEDYPAEPVPNGKTVLHALERLPAFVAQASGHRYAMTHVPGFTW